MQSTKSFMASPNERKAMWSRLQHYSAHASAARTAYGLVAVPSPSNMRRRNRFLESVAKMARFGTRPELRSAGRCTRRTLPNERAVIAGMERIRMRLGQSRKVPLASDQQKKSRQAPATRLLSRSLECSQRFPCTAVILFAATRWEDRKSAVIRL